MLRSSSGMLLSQARAGALETVMGQIDPVRHSLGWLFLLAAQGEALAGAAHWPPDDAEGAEGGAESGDDDEGGVGWADVAPAPALPAAGGEGGANGGNDADLELDEAPPAPPADPAAANPEAVESFMSRAAHFLLNCSAQQVGLAPGTFAMLCERFTSRCVASAQPLRAVAPLRAAAAKAQANALVSKPHGDGGQHAEGAKGGAPRRVLTPQHAYLLQACVAAKCYAAAEAVLAEELADVDPRATGLTPKDFLLYCFYGGCALLAVRRVAEAREIFAAAISAPARAPSAIALAAYKKWALASLLDVGTLPSLPKYTHHGLQRHVKSACQEYAGIAQVYESGKPAALKAKAEACRAKLATDGNWGLAVAVVESLHRRGVQRLTQTYLTLSLEDIAKNVGLQGGADEAESLLVRMVSRGEIFATVDRPAGMVSFCDDPDAHDSGASAARLGERVQQAIELGARLRAADAKVACDADYARGVSGKGRGFSGGARGMAWDDMLGGGAGVDAPMSTGMLG